MPEDKIPMECKKCGHDWETGSKLITVSCPSCGTKNKVPGRE